MRLYRGKIPLISEEITSTLIQNEAIEVENTLVAEVILDVESVLKEYNRLDREITEQAKDLIAARKMDYSQLHRVRQTLAKRRDFGINEHAFDWITAQLLEVMMHSRNVEEVYAEDNILRRMMVQVLRTHTDMENELDRQVRNRIKNLQEGTQNWDVEYNKVLSDLRQNKGLD